MRPTVRPGDIAYVRVRVIGQVKANGFGEIAVEPIDKFTQQSRPGMYMYVEDKEVITLEEARRLVK